MTKPADSCMAFLRGIRDAVLIIAFIVGALYANDHFSVATPEIEAGSSGATPGAQANTAPMDVAGASVQR